MQGSVLYMEWTNYGSDTLRCGAGFMAHAGVVMQDGGKRPLLCQDEHSLPEGMSICPAIWWQEMNDAVVHALFSFTF